MEKNTKNPTFRHWPIFTMKGCTDKEYFHCRAHSAVTYKGRYRAARATKKLNIHKCSKFLKKTPVGSENCFSAF